MKEFWAWYNRQCNKRFVGLLMIPATIFVCFLPMLLFGAIQERYLKYRQEKTRVYYEQLDAKRAAIYAAGGDPDKP